MSTKPCSRFASFNYPAVALIMIITVGIGCTDDESTPTPTLLPSANPDGDSPHSTEAPVESPAVTGEPTSEVNSPAPWQTPGSSPEASPAETSPGQSPTNSPLPSTTPTTVSPTPRDSPSPDPVVVYSPEVALTSGSIRGIESAADTYAYLGIPYAKPPLDSLRWQPPQDPEPWAGVRDAITLGNACPQIESADTDGDGENELFPIGNEDCLQLNAWHPRAEASSPRPIMVWLHGGGNIQGSATDPLYDGANLAATADVVLISANYRLNYLGYFWHSALKTGDPWTDSGAFGTLDILKLLDWVQDNGAQFGGDISRVTLFGESAGGVNTWAMIQSEYGANLFHRAIVQSGCPSYKSIDDMTATSNALLELLVVADGLTTEEEAAEYLETQGDAWIYDYLMNKSPEAVLQISADNGAMDTKDYGPILDDFLLPSDWNTRLIDGNYNRIPMIIGSNRDEQKLFYYYLSDMTELEYQALMKLLYGEDVEAVEALYPRDAYSPSTPYNQFVDIQDLTLELICSPYVAYLVEGYQPTWMYHFRYDDLATGYDYVFGAAHGFELPISFGNYVFDVYQESDLEAREIMSDQIGTYWGCFAATGDPNCQSLTHWERFSSSSEPTYQRLVWDTSMALEPVTQLDWERINFWIDYYDIVLPPVEIESDD